MSGIRGWTSAALKIPVEPDAPEARQWLREELAKPPYRAAQPTWFDRLSKGFLDWLQSVMGADGGRPGPWVPVLLTVIVIAVLVAAFLIFGLPRLNRRSRVTAPLFGDSDRRVAEELRRAAATAAARGDWSLASAEMFRSITRGLAERTILVLTPGTTARSVAALASAAFPGERPRLADAATVFDRVRYLGGTGSRSDFESLAGLDRDLRRARPVTGGDRDDHTVTAVS